ncbi:MAG: twin-arginine translocase TatA/TatE family subunit [Planctomyces sp.]|nr:twin-arginine translocase TatA/TatE family subunit [Planctomyces sp.]
MFQSTANIVSGIGQGTSVLAVFGMPGHLELVILLVIIVLLFGKRLPGAMMSLGQSFGAFKKGIKEGNEENGGSDVESARPN